MKIEETVVTFSFKCQILFWVGAFIEVDWVRTQSLMHAR